MLSDQFRCTRHAIINALMEYYHRRGYSILFLDDRKGLVVAGQGLYALFLGRKIRVDIYEVHSGVQVRVECSRRLGPLDFGKASRIERDIIEQLKQDV
jgi:hypothetical protein